MRPPAAVQSSNTKPDLSAYCTPVSHSCQLHESGDEGPRETVCGLDTCHTDLRQIYFVVACGGVTFTTVTSPLPEPVGWRLGVQYSVCGTVLCSRLAAHVPPKPELLRLPSLCLIGNIPLCEASGVLQGSVVTCCN